MKIFFHADDFGITYEQSKSILECYNFGMLNSVSIILNSPETAHSFELIRELVDEGKLRCVAHLNFVEGKSMAKDVPHLTNLEGYFNCSFQSILKASYGASRNALKKDLLREIDAQLLLYSTLIGTKNISVDSHQHYHMIPVVWEALLEVISRNGYTIEYIRIPVDPVMPIFKNGYLFKVKSINYIKWGLLWLLKLLNNKKSLSSAKIPAFFGIPFTCEMACDVIKKLLPKYLDVASSSNTDLEIMFHPGAIKNTADLLDKSNQQLANFYGSKYRDMEKETLLMSKL